ncbi:MAG: DNRLRE domain-containing protein [Candidatus Manganitrophaceae bacterium]
MINETFRLINGNANRNRLRFFTWVALLYLFQSIPALAGDAVLSWNPNTEADLAGYKVYYGTSSRKYGAPLTIGKQTSYTVTGLAAGTYFFSLTAFDIAGNQSGFSNEVQKIVSAGGSVSAFQQSTAADGLVSFEAERYHGNVSQGGRAWTLVTTPSGYSGTGAMVATPNSGANVNTGYTTGSPRLDFRVNFVKTGIHYIWIRGRGATASDDSVHVGLDGATPASADRIVATSLASWNWTKSTMDGVVATFSVPSTGLHTVNVWMREDGFIFDKGVLTSSSTYTPSGVGPTQSTTTTVQLKSASVTMDAIPVNPGASPDLSDPCGDPSACLSMTLSPMTDTVISVRDGTTGLDPLLSTETWPDRQIAKAILMKFDLSKVPTGAVIRQATLYLTQIESDTASDDTYAMTLHKIIHKSPNLEKANGMTYDGVNPWTENQCCYKGIPLAQADLSFAYDIQEVDKKPVDKSWDMSALVQEWIDRPETNFGILLNGDPNKGSDRYRSFASVDHPDTHMRPRLNLLIEERRSPLQAAGSGVLSGDQTGGGCSMLVPIGGDPSAPATAPEGAADMMALIGMILAAWLRRRVRRGRGER